MTSNSMEARSAVLTHCLPPVVEVVDAAKTYSDGFEALQPVNLSIGTGEFITLLGPSGCGKSTLLRMISGLTKPSSGEIRLWPNQKGGTAKAPSQSTQNKLSFVFQSPTLMPWADVRANVRLPLDLAGVPRKTADSQVDEVLCTVGLSDFASSLPKALSGGMQMRVSIARGLITKPNLLLMDEPFGALDEITRYKLDSELLGLWASHKLTVIFVTHSIHEAVFLSSKIIMMGAKPGRINQEFLINEPYPRTPSFMVSKEFLEYSQTVQASLMKAST